MALDAVGVHDSVVSKLANAELDELDRLRNIDPRQMHEMLKSLGVLKLGARIRVEAYLRHRFQQAPPPAPQAPPSPPSPSCLPPPPPQSRPAPRPSSPPREKIATVAGSNPTDMDLTAVQCVSLLKELLQRYAEPDFRAQIAEAQRSRDVARLGPIVLRAQAPVLPRYGLPATPAGVELMKFAIHRRIAEGATELQHLANEARCALGLQPLPATRQQRAEEMLVEMARARHDDGAALRLHDVVEAKLRASLGSGTLPPATRALLEARLPHLTPAVAACVVAMATAGLPVATLRAVAADSVLEDPHRALAEVPVLDIMPSPAAFFAAHVLPSRPAILRGLVSAESFAPLRDFPDFDFLRHRCGHRRVPVKSLALDDKDGRPIFVSDPEIKMPLVGFLSAVEASERSGQRCPFYLGKVPLRSELPELDEALAVACSSPAHVLGEECFGKLNREGVYTYFGCDRNVTPTHFDGYENLLICLCGTKRLWLYPPSDARHLYAAAGPKRDASRAAAPPFQSFDDLSAELRASFPEVAHAKPLEVRLGAGDCLYLPACWWHCVEGSRERNMILNWWFDVHANKRGHEGEL